MAPDALMNSWNCLFPNYQIRVDDLQNVKPMFLMEAIFVIFDALDIDGDKIIRHQPDAERVSQFENFEAFSPLVPLINLSAAVNLIIDVMGQDCLKITFYDLMCPTAQMTQNLLLVLANFVTFVRQYANTAIDEENKIQEFAFEAEELLNTREELVNRFAKLIEEDKVRDSKIKKLEEKKHLLKEQLEELERHRETCASELSSVQLQNENLVNELKNQQDQINTLGEEITRLEKCVVNEEDEKKAYEEKEEVTRWEKEVAERLEEDKALIWQKDAIVKTLENNTPQIVQCQKILNNLEKLYETIRELKSIGDPDSTEEEEKKRLEHQKEEIINNINNLKYEDTQWEAKMEESIKKLQQELENTKQMEKKTEEIAKSTSEKISQLQNESATLQQKIKEHEKEHEKLMKYYTSTIPQQYDDKVQSNISSIDSIIDELREYFVTNQH